MPEDAARHVGSFVGEASLVEAWLRDCANHGVVHVPCDPPQTGMISTGGRRECFETVVVLSVPAAGGGRVAVAVGHGDANVCQRGCWCASVKTLTVVAAAPGVAPVTLAALSWGAREAEGQGEHWSFDVAAGEDVSELAARLPAVSGDPVAALLRFAMLAANVEGKGREHWARVARGEAFLGYGWGDEERAEEDTDGEADDDAGTASARTRESATNPLQRLMMGLADKRKFATPAETVVGGARRVKATARRDAHLHYSADSSCGALTETRALLAAAAEAPSLEAFAGALNGEAAWQARVLAAMREKTPVVFEVDEMRDY